MKITKQTLREAITTATLCQGAWVLRTRKSKVGTCPTCAVGAVLRGVGLANDVLDLVARSLIRTNAGDWARGLSDVFERAPWSYAREMALEYVETLPDEVEIPDDLITSADYDAWVFLADWLRYRGHAVPANPTPEERAHFREVGYVGSESETGGFIL